MLVHQILKLKSDDAVVTVPPGTKVSEAAKILAERKIGTVVVSANAQTADGILSERDIVRVLAQKGGSVLSDAVDAHMTTQLVTCGRNDDADAVLSTMTERRFRHMPVVEDGQLVGLITIGDVVKARLTELAMEKDALQGMIMGH
ncbi:CBS domain-containing protein [Tateyamaria omphalii]|uniref:CBS domain-containing protein n=1 Tax=Tateyamaria omphalii TaxID=299262 RepID=UPI001C9A1EE3|nr:CBS domain-containing protein [Tateyamaria omphalii]MBY5932927.1 CBS domain-containing protein [Tateyamaria omphalii]